MIFTKILCPIDFSDGSQRALEAAVGLALASGATLAILHAWELPVFAGGYTAAPAVVQDMTDAIQRGLAEAAAFARGRGVTAVATLDPSGVPWRTIVDTVSSDPTIDLVVMGTHGRTGLRRVMLGSVAEKVVRLSPSSVLAVHPDDPVGPFRYISCPTDFSPVSDVALGLAAQLVDGPDAKIELVHVVELPGVIERGSHAIALAHDLEQQSEAELERRAKPILDVAHVSWRTEAGPATERLLELLDRDPIDLVVVGSHGRTGFAHPPLGSVAEKLVRHAHCPVLVARRRDADQ